MIPTVKARMIQNSQKTSRKNAPYATHSDWPWDPCIKSKGYVSHIGNVGEASSLLHSPRGVGGEDPCDRNRLLCEGENSG